MPTPLTNTGLSNTDLIDTDANTRELNTRELDTRELDTRDANLELTILLANAADDRKGGDICLFKVSEVTFITEYLVIVTGYSRTQVRAIADAMEHKAQKELQRDPLRKAGESDRSWIVLDYGDVMAHIMLPEQREYYNLEAFWGHSEQIEFIPSPQS